MGASKRRRRQEGLNLLAINQRNFVVVVAAAAAVSAAAPPPPSSLDPPSPPPSPPPKLWPPSSPSSQFGVFLERASRSWAVRNPTLPRANSFPQFEESESLHFKKESALGGCVNHKAYHKILYSKRLKHRPSTEITQPPGVDSGITTPTTGV